MKLLLFEDCNKEEGELKLSRVPVPVPPLVLPPVKVPVLVPVKVPVLVLVLTLDDEKAFVDILNKEGIAK